MNLPLSLPRILVLVCSLGLFCGGDPTRAAPPPEAEQEAGQPPATVPEKRAETTGNTFDIFAKIPSTASLVMTLPSLGQSLVRLDDILQKPGLQDLFPESAFASFQELTGLDLSHPLALAATGINLLDAAAFVRDGSLTYDNCSLRPGTATVLIEPLPVTYAVLSLSDPRLFDEWVRGLLLRIEPSLRFEEEAWGDLRVTYVRGNLDWPVSVLPSTIPASPLERISAVMVQKESLLYFFFTKLGQPDTEEIPDPAAAFREKLREFMTNPAPFVENPSIQASLQKAGRGDLVLYYDLALAAAQHEKGGPDRAVYVQTKDPKLAREQKKVREEIEASVQRHEEHTREGKELGEAFNRLAFSVSLEEERLRASAFIAVGPPWRYRIESILTSAGTTPTYEGYLDPLTSSFFRFSLRPDGVRDFFFSILPKSEMASLEASWKELRTNAATLGLDLERDVLGAFTGDCLLEIPPVLRIAAQDNILMCQLTDPAAGDKLLTALARFLTPSGALTTESFYGRTLYNLVSTGSSVSLTRDGDILLVAFHPSALKDALRRSKAPGDSFVDALPSSLARDLATKKGDNGWVIDVGQYLPLVALAVPNPGLKETLSRLGGTLGVWVFALRYQDAGIQLSSEVALR